MSRRVIFTCTLLMLIGVGGCFDLLTSLARGGIPINFTALLLPAAIGPFMGIPAARTLASFVLVISYLGLAAALLLGSLPSSHTSMTLFGLDLPMRGFPVMFVFVAVIASVLALLHWLLYSQPFDDHLQRQARP